MDSCANVQRLLSDIRGTGARVLAVGENHYTPNQLHQYVSALLPHLISIGFTHVCVEIFSGLTDYLQRYLDGEISLSSLKANLVQRAFDPKSGARVFVGDDYYSALHLAYGGGLSVQGVDLRLGARDVGMAASISEILASSDSNRVLFWVGRGHAALRSSTTQYKHKTAAELLQEQFGLDSVYALSQISRRPESQGPFHSGPRLLLRDDLEQNGVPVAAVDMDFDCSANSKTDCDHPIEKITVKFGDWDATYWCPEPLITHDSV